MEQKKLRMQELVELLNRASKAYYQDATEIMSNFEYDKLYDELVALEVELGIAMANSPTVNVGYEVLSELPKERHEKPMLSLDKTKEVSKLKEFLGIQKRLMQEHVERLVEQEALIKQRQQDTEKQMERLKQLQSEVYQKEEIKEYLEELKEQYKELTVYHYCDDMPLNALLNRKLQKLREEGVNIHVEINNIVFSEEIRKELWIAINEVIEEVENIKKQELMIKIFEMKGQICVQYTVTGRQSKQKIVTM